MQASVVKILPNGIAPKRGDVRDDGKVYWGISSRGNPYWMNRETFERNLEARRNIVKRYKDKNKDKTRDYYISNKDLIREKQRKYYLLNSERIKQKTKEWAESNKDKVDLIRISNKNKRRQRESRSQLSKIEKLIMRQFYAQRKRVSDCLGILFHVDHIMPLSRGGIHHPSNLRIIPAIENMKKFNKTPEEFYENT